MTTLHKITAGAGLALLLGASVALAQTKDQTPGSGQSQPPADMMGPGGMMSMMTQMNEMMETCNVMMKQHEVPDSKVQPRD